MGILRFAVKSGIIYVAGYYTKSIGVWGTQIESEKVFNDIKNIGKPYWKDATKNINFTLPTLPARSEISFVIKHYYNQGVKNTFHFISMSPCYVGQFVNKTKETVQKALEAPPVKQ